MLCAHFISLSVSLLVVAITPKLIYISFGIYLCCGFYVSHQRKKWLNFGTDPDHTLDTKKIPNF